MDEAGPSTSGLYAPEPPGSSIDQDKIVFAFEREYFSTYGDEPQKPKTAKAAAAALFNPFQNGLQLRDQELVDFLNERLGDHEETWAGKNVAAFLSREMIEELETCFQGLEPIAKLKIVLGFSQLSTKRLHDWKKEINTLLEIASQDPDDWVEAISDNLRIFSPTGIIELEPTKNLDAYKEALNRVYQKMLEFANREDSEFDHVPELYHFCDEKVIENELNYTPREPEVHFSVKKKLKADIMREEMLADLKEPKPTEDKTAPIVSTLPMKYRSTLRKPDLKTPMKGIVQPNKSKINGGFTSEPKKFPRQLAKRDGGSMLIAIDDIPHSHLKRKKEIEKEERDKKKEQDAIERKRLEAERKKALAEKAEQKKKEAERLREEAARKKKEAEEARLEALKKPDPPPPKPKPVETAPSFSDPSVELERLRAQQPTVTMMDLDGNEAMERNESDKAVEWMYQHDEASLSKIGDNKEDDYEFLNRARPAGLESRETIIQKSTTEMIDTITCCTLEHQRQIVAFMSGNRITYRPLLGSTNILKIADAIQQGIIDDGVVRVRVETFMHMDFDSGEWRKQQKCKVLAKDETPRDFDGRQCPRLTHQQIFNEIARHLTDEPEDKKFAGESVIVQAYVPATPSVELKLTDDNTRLLSPTGVPTNEVVYGQEVTAGEMMTVQIGISGCTGMRTIVGKSTLLSPALLAAAASSGAIPAGSIPAPQVITVQTTTTAPPPVVLTVTQPLPQQQQSAQPIAATPKASKKKTPKAASYKAQPVQQPQPQQPSYISIDADQLAQIQQQFAGQQPTFVISQAPPQQQQPRIVVQQQMPHQPAQHQRMLSQQPLHHQPQPMMMGMPRGHQHIPQSLPQSMPSYSHQNMNHNSNGHLQPNLPPSFFQNQQFPPGTQMFVMEGNNMQRFDIVPASQMNPNGTLQQQYQPVPANEPYRYPDGRTTPPMFRYM